MEAEARAILESALSAGDDDGTDLGAFARGLFAPLGGIDLAIPARGPARAAPNIAIAAGEGEIANANANANAGGGTTSGPASADDAGGAPNADPGPEGGDDRANAAAGQGGTSDGGPSDGEGTPAVAGQGRKGARR